LECYKKLEIHHKIKRSQQGDDTLENLLTLCAYCHMAEHGQLSCETWATGILEKTLNERGVSLLSSVSCNLRKALRRPRAGAALGREVLGLSESASLTWP